MERNYYMLEELSVRENHLRKGNILVNSKNLHISLKTDGDNLE